jgi:hypothetical protein
MIIKVSPKALVFIRAALYILLGANAGTLTDLANVGNHIPAA